MYYLKILNGLTTVWSSNSIESLILENDIEITIKWYAIKRYYFFKYLTFFVTFFLKKVSNTDIHCAWLYF